MNGVTFSQAVFGFELTCHARRLSPRTIRDYQNTFRKFSTFLNGADPALGDISTGQVRAFLASQHGISKKTLLNYHTGLSALWSWAIREGYAGEHILRQVERPEPEKTVIVPYTEADLRAMLAVVGKSRNYIRPGKRECNHSLPNELRDRSILLLLLDTGLRASELCGLRLGQTDLKNARVEVMGKGAKKRSLPFSPRTGKSLWQYLTTRLDDPPGQYTFLTQWGDPLDRGRLYHLVVSIAERAGVEHAAVHRFRHTFAIQYLRNGGDAYSLQIMLGHSTMEMVRRYLSIAQADLDNQHRIASPVSNWRL
jgi:site-specific recombinase XerD